jgi:hypothetical protein
MIRSRLILLNRPRGTWAQPPVPPSLPAPIQQPLFLPGIADPGRLGQGEEHDLFTGHGADVVVQAQRRFAGGLLDQRFQNRPRRFDQLGPDLLDGQGPSGCTDASRIGHARPGHEHEHRPRRALRRVPGSAWPSGAGKQADPMRPPSSRLRDALARLIARLGNQAGAEQLPVADRRMEVPLADQDLALRSETPK